MSDDMARPPLIDGASTAAAPKRRIWIWLLPVLLLVVAAPFICCGGFLWFGLNVATEPIEAAVRSLNQDQRVTAKLGSPVKSGSTFGVEHYSNENNNGGAKVNFQAVGPDGSAQVTGQMRLNTGTWSAEDLTVRFDDGSEVQLPEPNLD